jgi:TPR repeat protein
MMFFDSADSCCQGECYAVGLGVEQNWTTACDYFQQAASRGDQVAAFKLAECYLLGRGVPQNEHVAMQLYKQFGQPGKQ